MKVNFVYTATFNREKTMNNFMLKIAVILAFTCGLPAQVITPESVVEMTKVSEVALQPQGKFIAYTLQAPGTPMSPQEAHIKSSGSFR